MNQLFQSYWRWRRAAPRGVQLGLAAVAVTLISGCANHNASSSVYSYGQAQREQIIRMGTVQGLRPVTIQSDETSGAGVVGGGLLGGIAGSSLGGGNGRSLAAVGGALLGALAGNSVENRVDKTKGVEITVRFDNGEIRAITQAADLPIHVGQRVQVASGAGPTRVSPAP